MFIILRIITYVNEKNTYFYVIRIKPTKSALDKFRRKTYNVKK